MASRFPIQYSQQAPSGRTGAVPYNFDVRTGQGQIGEAVSGAATTFGQVYGKLKDADRAIEFSEKERQMRQHAQDALDSIPVTSDQSAIEKLRAEAFKKMDAVTSDDPKVQQQIEISRNNFAPTFNYWWNSKSQRQIHEDLNVRMKTQDGADLETGDAFNYAKRQQLAVDTGMIGKTEADYKIANFPIQSKLTIIQKSILSDSDEAHVRAANLIKELPDEKLSEPQLEAKVKLQSLINKVNKEDSNNIENAVLFDMHKNRAVSTADRQLLGEQYIQQLKTSNITPENARVMIDRVEKWTNNVDVKSEAGLKANLTTQIYQAKANKTDMSSLRQKIIDNNSKLSIDDYDSLMLSIDKKVDSAKAKALNLTMDAYKQSIGFDEETEPYFQAAIIDWQDEHPDATLVETLKAGYGLAALWSKKSPEQVVRETLQGAPQIISVRTKEEYDALPKGAKYKDIKGNVGTKK